MSIIDSKDKQILDALRDISRRVRRLETLENPVDIPSAADFFSQAGFGKIIRFLNQGGGIEVYEVDYDGLTSALGNSVDYDDVWIPNCTIAGNFVVPRNVRFQSYAKKSVIEGMITLQEGSVVRNIQIERTVLGGAVQYMYLYDYDNAYGFVGPSSGTGVLEDCTVTISHLGFGHIFGIYQADVAGRLEVYDCISEVSQVGQWGDAYGIGVDGGAEVFVKDTILYGVSSPHFGFGGYVFNGDLEVDGGKAYGSRARFGKA